MITGYENFKGITLKKDEVIGTTASPSVKGLLFTWATIPGGALLIWLIFYLPVIIRVAVSSAFKKAVVSALGVSSYSDVSITDYIFRNVPGFIKGFLGFIVFLLVAAWLGWCLVMTWRHMRNSLAITNFRVIGKAGDETLDSPLSEVKNVFIEQSLWGKIMGFGSIVVSTKSKSLTFRNIDNPTRVYKLLMDQAENYCSN